MRPEIPVQPPPRRSDLKRGTGCSLGHGCPDWSLDDGTVTLVAVVVALVDTAGSERAAKVVRREHGLAKDGDLVVRRGADAGMC